MTPAKIAEAVRNAVAAYVSRHGKGCRIFIDDSHKPEPSDPFVGWGIWAGTSKFGAGMEFRTGKLRRSNRPGGPELADLIEERMER